MLGRYPISYPCVDILLNKIIGILHGARAESKLIMINGRAFIKDGREKNGILIFQNS